MGFENLFTSSNKELVPKSKIEIESGLDSFVPEKFKSNPVEYFESEGKNIKPGEIKRTFLGKVKEDPTAVKELPVWKDGVGNELKTIGKRVNIKKGKTGESGDPFYEYKVMEIVKSVGLPTPSPIAKVEFNGVHLIVMEKAAGVGWYEQRDVKNSEHLKQQAEKMMDELRIKFEEAGITRGWKLKDMIFDIQKNEIKRLIPVDWERTRIDFKKLEEYKIKNGLI
ncbi:MAG: hypothetical protein M1155_02650 [Patescibacteria group bacterium]|nr:hypothetical protein [Patescibacteria group bacterium]